MKILFENDDVVVIDKPYGMVVHPGAGVEMGETVVGEALKVYPDLPITNGEDRPGVVHRLDKDTSGVLLLAKTEVSLRFYIEAWKKHHVEKVYFGLVAGKVEPKTGTIEAPVSRSVKDRKKMTAKSGIGKMAVTHYEVVEYFSDFDFPVTLVKIRIETGRTHQIRVHFAAIGFPVVGDDVYGNRHVNAFFEKEFGLKRQFLHAQLLEFPLMNSKKKETVESKIPSELQKVLDDLS